MLYETFKFLHIMGVVLLVGNVTITAVWKVFADRTADAGIVGYAQRLVTITDFVFTGGGIVFVMVGGYGMLWLTQTHPLDQPFLVWGQGLFIVSGLMWLFILIPAQIRQGRLAKTFRHGDVVPESYWRDARIWTVWGIIATLPLAVATFLMIAKP